MPLLKKGEYATARGWHPSYVSKLLKEGKISATPEGLIDSEDADRRLAQAKDPAKEHVAARHAEARGEAPNDSAPDLPAAGGGESVNASYHKARTVRESYQARLSKLEYERQSGNLKPVAEIRVAAFKAAREFRDALGNVPDRLAAVVAAESDAAKVHTLITQEIDRALNELSNRLARVEQDVRGGAV